MPLKLLILLCLFPSLVMANSLNLALNPLSGVSLGGSYTLNDTFSLRGQYGLGLSYQQAQQDADSQTNYQLTTEAQIHRLAIDYTPFQTGFFLSAGYAVNPLTVDFIVDAQDGERIELGQTEFYATQNSHVTGNLSWQNGATLSTGWQMNISDNWQGLIEIGMILTGSPTAKMQGDGTLTSGNSAFGHFPLDINTDSLVQDALVDEEKELEKDYADYWWLPLFQIGLHYRF